MSRKRITLRIPPLPRRPVFQAQDNKTELLRSWLREAALSNQVAEPQHFYPLREVARRFRVPLSLAAHAYQALEREGLLRPIRGSGTILEGLNTTRRGSVRGVVAIAASLSQFLTRQDYRMFSLALERELRRRDYSSASTFFEVGETADDLAERLAQSHPDMVFWYSPERMSREVALRLHDRGIKIVGVGGGGFPGIPCRYEVRRDLALAQIADEWKGDAIVSVQIAVAANQSGADEEMIGRTFDGLGMAVRFVTVGSQTVKRFINHLTGGLKMGIIALNSVAAMLAIDEPEALELLTRRTRVGLLEGPVALPSTKAVNATVDLVTVDWKSVSQHILDDITKPRSSALAEPYIFQAKAEFQVPLHSYSQRI